MTARSLMGALLGVAALLAGAWAEEPAAGSAEEPKAGCEQMMQKHKSDLADLEAKAAAMNAAQPAEKVDAIAAVVNDLVAQQRAMPGGCPMMNEMSEKMHGMMGGWNTAAATTVGCSTTRPPRRAERPRPEPSRAARAQAACESIRPPSRW
jgi:hypothetical protein